MKINTKSFNLVPTLVFLALFHLSLVSCNKSIGSHSANGFTLDLIHRDSPLSPLYNPSNAPYDRLQNAFQRSFSRASFFKKNSINTIQSTIVPIPSEYLMKISIGTPAIDTLAIADTGSDLTWIQCEPCVECFKQMAPIFNPKNSSSYKTIGCKEKICQEVGSSACKNNICGYEVTYGDHSETSGDLSSETFTFASNSSQNVSIPNIIFGCGHDNGGTFPNTTSGIIGLGGGTVSIVNQMNQEIKGKFSYCLIPLESSSTNSNATSHINFGDSAIVTGPGVVSTPLIKSEETETFYFLTLEGITVGNKTLPFKYSSKLSSNDQGNIIIDSGTTLTLLPFEFYSDLEKQLVASINATRKDDPSGLFKVCYESKNGTIDAPKLVAHFTNADVELSPINTFTQVAEGLVCFTILPEVDIAIFGNLAQRNFLIGYDLVAKKVSFLPTDCTKH
ncbi:aspartic proteinase CDR1-like [Nicotiana sylvestris]|uniref:Aspartic proteinase CDR1-like n=1 Tax=Nicotiana sylvestris TaxID=4096 RepID=A0A1U7VXN6_NICSY|nr:PREDICTED: aspartic proteinase CDR1-like [Nicotiana sylvestris]